jgi:hypothetical protein
MAVPANITYVSVAGRYVNASGQPISGKLTFTPNASRIRDEVDNTFIATVPVTVTLDSQGNFSVSLMVVNDPDVHPSGWTYTVEEDLRGKGNFSGGKAVYSIQITSSMAPGPVYLTDIDPITPIFAQYDAYVSSVNGMNGTVVITAASLGLGNSATRDIGQATGTVAAGDDPRLATLSIPGTGQLKTTNAFRVTDRVTVGSDTQGVEKLHVEDATATNPVALIKASVLGTNTVAMLRLEGPSGKRAIEHRVAGETNPRWQVKGDGRIVLGNGTAEDVELIRSNNDVLKTPDSLVVGTRLKVGGSDTDSPASAIIEADCAGETNAIVAKATAAGTTDTAVVSIETSIQDKRALEYKVTGDTVPRLKLDGSQGGAGTLTFGNGTVADTYITRSGTQKLKMSGDLEVIGTLTVGSFSTGGTTPTDSVGYVFEAPAGAVIRSIYRAPKALTIMAVRAYRNGGTGATINARNGATNTIAVTNLSLTTADTWMAAGTLQNTAVANGGFIMVEVVTVAGSPAYITVEVDYQVSA